MLLPHRRLLWFLAGWFGLALPAIWFSPGETVWRAAGGLLLAVAAADAWRAMARGNPLWVQRDLKPIWPIGATQTIALRLAAAHGSRHATYSGWVYDRPPEAFAAAAVPLEFRVAPNEWTRVAYNLMPSERGAHRFGAIDLRILSPLGLWVTQHTAGAAEVVRVYPDFKSLTEYALLAMDNRLSQLGVLRKRRRGEGSEFHQLRDYRQDDAVRRIDWKATARRRRPIVREYQDERDQQIFFVLDCGQRMRTRDGALAHFDHTLNAMLLLAYVALRQGDAVGFCTFADASPRFFAPRKGMGTIQKLLNLTYDLQPTERVPDYLAASQRVAEGLDKRALIVLLTNLRDEDDATLPAALSTLGRKHLLLIANLREMILDTLLQEPIDDFGAALTYAAALDYREARRRQLATLSARGAHVLDVAPAHLPIALVNRYWDIKRSGIF